VYEEDRKLVGRMLAGDGFSVQEMARMLGITTVAAQSLLARTRDAFREGWRREQMQ
jgi:DNA-directed RNA polymerase specialized sigma24 family protein